MRDAKETCAIPRSAVGTEEIVFSISSPPLLVPEQSSQPGTITHVPGAKTNAGMMMIARHLTTIPVPKNADSSAAFRR